MDPMEDPAAFHARQAEIVAPDDLGWPVHLIGAGAVGSYAALFLAKLGCTELHVYDDDRVAPENVGPQLYGPGDVGQLKVEALATRVEALAGVPIATHARRVEREPLSGVVILAVDTMAARRAIFEACVVGRAAVRWLLDVRIGFLSDAARTATGLLFTVRPLDAGACDEYRRSLHDDASALPASCGAGGVVYTSALAAGAVTRRIKQLAREEPVPLMERVL